MSPLQAFEVFFILSQLIRHSMEAFYLLSKKVEDTPFRYTVGFGCVVSACWFLTSFLNRDNIHPVSQG